MHYGIEYGPKGLARVFTFKTFLLLAAWVSLGKRKKREGLHSKHRYVRRAQAEAARIRPFGLKVSREALSQGVVIEVDP